jgi:anthranilate/para-aminobenzoate synthase component II
MLLLVDNSKIKNDNDIDSISFTTKLKKALHNLSIPFVIFYAWKDDPGSIPEGISRVILSGSKLTLSKEPKHPMVLKNMEIIRKFANLPILGICFGCQVMMQTYYNKPHINLGDYFTKKIGVHHTDIDLFKTWKTDAKGEKMSQFYFSDYPESSHALNGKAIAWMNGYDIPCAWRYRKKHYGMLFHPEASKSSHAILVQFAKL